MQPDPVHATKRCCCGGKTLFSNDNDVVQIKTNDNFQWLVRASNNIVKGRWARATIRIITYKLTIILYKLLKNEYTQTGMSHRVRDKTFFHYINVSRSYSTSHLCNSAHKCSCIILDFINLIDYELHCFSKINFWTYIILFVWGVCQKGHSTQFSLWTH